MEERGEIIPTPWVAQPDNIENFYKTGTTYVNNIAFSGSNEAGDFRLSYTNLEQKGIVPNTDLGRNTFSLNAGYKFAKKLSARVSVNYVDGKSDNRPNLRRSEEHTSELQSLMRISYAVFCLKKKTTLICQHNSQSQIL